MATVSRFTNALVKRLQQARSTYGRSVITFSGTYNFTRDFHHYSRSRANNSLFTGHNLKSCNTKVLSCSATHQAAPGPHHLTDVSQNEAVQCLITRWSNGEEMMYPYVWMRDNCQCSNCFDRSATMRLLLARHLDPDVSPLQVDFEGRKIQIHWSDGHESVFDHNWLYQRRFTEDARTQYEYRLSSKVQPWGSDIQVPTGDFNQIMEDDMALLNWIEKLETLGLFVIKNSPTELGQIGKLGKRAGILRETNYGYNFHVEKKMEPSNVAYTGSTLGLHTDLPYYMHPPGMQLLHCIKQVTMEGGDNELADGFMAAQQLQKDYPEYFDLLCSQPLNYHDIGTDHYRFYKMMKHPVIKVNSEGKVWQITYNPQARDSFLSLPPEVVHKYYKALCKFDELLYNERNLVRLKLQPGDIMCFHNYRVLHGRAGFSQTEGGERLLEGGYIDWDVLHSTRRVILMDHKLQP